MVRPPKLPPKFSFAVSHSELQFGSRLGEVLLLRSNGQLKIETPGLVVTSSRGVIPHLSRDHANLTEAIRWINVPFESFLERDPPLPTIYPGAHALHEFLGYLPEKYIVSMSARDPSDVQEMPTNGKDHVSVKCIRGVRKLTTALWKDFVLTSNADFVVALSDTPFTKPPYSQKRLTKSIERSAAWLSDLLRPLLPVSGEDSQSETSPNVFVHMAGGANVLARQVFSESLLETLHGEEAEALKPLKTLDEGVAGYMFDLAPLRISLSSSVTVENLLQFLKASLELLPQNKLRIVNSTKSPHEILRLVQHIGVDIFDSHWAQQAANVGVALDFTFPIRHSLSNPKCSVPRKRENGKFDIGHNLYDRLYAGDFSPFAASFINGANRTGDELYCPCAACSPVAPTTQLRYSTVDEHGSSEPGFLNPCTRAYLHHLLHTHEMSAHALLVMHNLSVLDAFFAGIRDLIKERGSVGLDEEVARFVDYYDEPLVLVDEGWKDWKDVEFARGKGRLARQKEELKDQDQGQDL